VEESGREELLDAAARLVVEDGFDAVSIPRIASYALVSEDQVLAHFGSLEDLLVTMLNREYTSLWTTIIDDIERDPKGGLLSHIYRYIITGVYERPLVRALYLADRDGLNTIMRSVHGLTYVPAIDTRADFIEQMKAVGMVRPEVESEPLAALMSAVSAGAALTAPDSQLDLVADGLFDLLSAAVDMDVTDTTAGKTTYVEYSLGLMSPRGAE
jgi:AcrR family transcriptional regulator